MNLSDFFGANELIEDGHFGSLGQSDSVYAETLAYCDTVHHLRRADANPAVSCLITTSELVSEVNSTRGLVVAGQPRNRFFDLHQHLLDNQLLEPEMEFGIGERCNIHPTAIVSPKSLIGDSVTIRENVVVGDHVSIGSHTFIDSGTQLGVEGLLSRTDENGNRLHVRHQGGVTIGEHCALLCNAVIVKSVHRGLHTTIGNHSIVGISSNIGHEAQLGDNVVISNNCVVARGARICDHGFVGTTVVIREYVTVGHQAQVKSGSIVVNDVPDQSVVSGNFARNHHQNMVDYLSAINRWKKPRS